MEKRKLAMYSSQNHLIDDDTSADENVKAYSNPAITQSDTDHEDIPLKVIRGRRIDVESEDLSDSYADDKNKLKEQSISTFSSGNESSDVVVPKRTKIKKHKIKETIDETEENVETASKNRKSSSSRSRSKKSSKNISVEENIELKPLESEETNRMKIYGVQVISADMLADHLYANSPYVIVMMVNIDGELIGGSKSTKMFEFHKKRVIIPRWDETVLYDADTIKKSTANVIIFFEIVDRRIINDKTSDEHLCWAFIKPHGFKRLDNMNKRLKLQLYRPDGSGNVFSTWKSKLWQRYPSVLHAVVKSLHVDVADDKINELKLAISQSVRRNEVGKLFNDIPNEKLTKRSKDEKCCVPNKILTRFDCGGVSMVKFSRCGMYLAQSNKINAKYVVIIRKIPEFDIIIMLAHHSSMVYDICWNYAGNKLVTASGDGSACVWDLTQPSKYTKQRLAHPTYVYTARMCNCNEDIIATGSYDRLIRIWSAKLKSGDVDVKQYELSEELEGHDGYVNAICFSESNEMFFSADSVGIVFKWVNGKNGWVRIMDIIVDEFKSKIINDIFLFPGGRKLVVILRNHDPWALDVTNSKVVTCYRDGTLNIYHSRGCITPCGTFIMSGNNIWVASSGELYANYNPIVFDHFPMISVDFHAFYNIAAMSCNRTNAPILSVGFCRGFKDGDLGLDSFATSLPFQSRLIKDSSVDSDRFKTAAIKVREEVHAENEKVKEFKLWNLLRKMDNILSSARKNQKNHYVMMNNVKPNAAIASPEIQSNPTITVDLTEFYNRMQTDPRLNSLDTYTVENEKRGKPKAFEIVGNSDVEGSSTLSNAESLEDDSNTYIIPNKS